MCFRYSLTHVPLFLRGETLNFYISAAHVKSGKLSFKEENLFDSLEHCKN